MKKTGAFDLIWSGLKLNLLHTSWNFERLQNAGFLFSIYNILKKIYSGDRENMLRAIKRNLNFFNTHMFFSGAALGVVARLEQDLDNARPEDKDREIDSVKMGIMGPLAAIGDALFWAGIKPIAFLAGAGLLMLTGFKTVYWPYAITVSLLIYNIPRVMIKYYLLFKAYYDYKQLFVLIQNIKFQEIMKAIKIIGMVVLGGVMAGYFMTRDLEMMQNRKLDNLLLLGIFAVVSIAIKRKSSITNIFITLVVGSILLAYTIF